ncbi:MAG: BatD family protein [Bacteroidales bacterium]|nr:BatD family protein [Bacteroidales bacterium]
MNVRKSYLIACLSLLMVWFVMPLAAQTQNKSFKPTCEVRAPKQVAKGELFTYTVITNAKADINDPDFGPFMVSGQGSNTSSSMKVENGKRYSKTRREHIFYLSADTIGMLTIPANQITVGGKKMQLDPVTIEVLPSTKNGQPEGLTVFYSDTFYDDGDLSTYDVVENYEPELMPVQKVRDPNRLRNILLYILLAIFALFVAVLVVASFKPMKEHFNNHPEDEGAAHQEEEPQQQEGEQKQQEEDSSAEGDVPKLPELPE